MRHLLASAVFFFAAVLSANADSAKGARGAVLKSTKTHVQAAHHRSGAVKLTVGKAKGQKLAQGKGKGKQTAVAVVAAPQLVVVKGIVLGPNSLALPGATVFPVGKLGQMVITNEEGEFSFTLPAAAARGLQLRAAYAGLGDWQVRVANPGHEALFITLMPVEMPQM